jgi:hypothetical protein
LDGLGRPSSSSSSSLLLGGGLGESLSIRSTEISNLPRHPKPKVSNSRFAVFRFLNFVAELGVSSPSSSSSSPVIENNGEPDLFLEALEGTEADFDREGGGIFLEADFWRGTLSSSSSSILIGSEY